MGHFVANHGQITPNRALLMLASFQIDWKSKCCFYWWLMMMAVHISVLNARNHKHTVEMAKIGMQKELHLLYSWEGVRETVWYMFCLSYMCLCSWVSLSYTSASAISNNFLLSCKHSHSVYCKLKSTSEHQNNLLLFPFLVSHSVTYILLCWNYN